MTVHRDNSLLIKPTDTLISNFIGIMTLHVSGSLSAHHQEFLAVHRHWYILCRFYDRLLPEAGWNSMEFHPAPGSKLEFSASVGFIHKESGLYLEEFKAASFYSLSMSLSKYTLPLYAVHSEILKESLKKAYVNKHCRKSGVSTVG